MEHLIAIQQELKAPKGQYNSFGKYKYRSAEDILEAVKPLCHKHGCVLTLTDELMNIGERYYVRATACIVTPEHKAYEVSAYAREDETKKGMDGSQITGTASSYARKYALNGLFCIDDTKDADTDAYKKIQMNSPMSREDKEDKVVELCDMKGKLVVDMCKYFKVTEVAEMSDDQLESAIKMLSK